MPGANPNSVARTIANFPPSPWGDQFLHYTPDTKAIEAQEELAKVLKVEINTELLSISHKPLLEQLNLIDSIERLGVAYHFEKEIQDALQRIHVDMPNASSQDLHLTSLRFRLLRQHGFKVSCDVFKGFISFKENIKEELSSDVAGMLSLYEACHVSIHEEDILDEALVFATSKLKKIMQNDELSHALKEQVRHALHKALHRRLTRLESLHYMQVYEQDPMHNKTLLRFAKLDFNLLQSSHKSELSNITRWWKNLGITTKLPLRDRLVECYFWGVGVHHEPQYSIGRKMFALSAQIMTSFDDLYDAFGTVQELEILTQAIQRWDKSCLDQLPEDYRWFYQTLVLDAFEEMECDVAAQGRSVYVNYAREEMKALSKTYLMEASWRQRKYTPTFDEYMEIAARNSGMVAQTPFAYLDMDIANHEAFEWVSSIPKSVMAVCLLMRIHNDISSMKFDATRGQAPVMTASYMRQHNVSHQQACKELLEKTHELWKDLSEAMIQPTEVPMPLLKCMLDMARLTDYTYDGGVDAYTEVNKGMMEDITSLFINPIPI